jgi:hypothetical protein
MVVLVSSPDRSIEARVENYTDVRISFRPGVFDRYDESELAYQLGRLGVTTWVAYHRERTEAYRASQGLSAEELADAERPSDDPRRQRYEEELNAIEGEGVSAGRLVRIRTTGMMRWNVDIEPGALRHLGEQGFLGELHSAIRALIQDREAKIILLKAEHFDLGLPRKWRDLTAELRAARAER